MSMRTEAEEHLRVIRSLMERATIYRAISAPAALIAGVLACVAGFVFTGRLFPRTSLDLEFQLKWLAVLLIASVVNFTFLARDARRRGDPFISPSMRLALRAMLPSLLCGAVFAFVFPGNAVVPFWLISYGLALLSTAHFAPASLTRLGWPFLLAGFGVLLSSVYQAGILAPDEPWDDYTMAATFGVFHIIYAVCAWPHRKTETEVVQVT
jgi:hypothetical protein